jgi:hypothetical protein
MNPATLAEVACRDLVAPLIAAEGLFPGNQAKRIGLDDGSSDGGLGADAAVTAAALEAGLEGDLEADCTAVAPTGVGRA